MITIAFISLAVVQALYGVFLFIVIRQHRRRAEQTRAQASDAATRAEWAAYRASGFRRSRKGLR